MFGDGCLAPPGHNKLKTASSSINRIYWQKKEEGLFSLLLTLFFFVCLCEKECICLCVLFCCVLETPHHRPPSQNYRKKWRNCPLRRKKACELKKGGDFRRWWARRKEELAAWGRIALPACTLVFVMWNVWIYMPCFFWSSRSSFQRVLTASIMTWTNWTSEYPRRCLLEMS